MEREGANLLDEVVWAAQDTLELYRSKIASGNYTDANELLGFVTALTLQAHNIEDHYAPNESGTTPPLAQT